MQKFILLYVMLINSVFAFGFRFNFFAKKQSLNNIKNFGSYRSWSDGSYATSCNNYKNPSGIYQYAGSIGDGVYRIKISSTTYDVYCLMSYDSYGWVKISSIYPNVRTSIISASYHSTSNYTAGNLATVYPFNTGQMLANVFKSGSCATLAQWSYNGYHLVSGSVSIATASGYESYSVNASYKSIGVSTMFLSYGYYAQDSLNEYVNFSNGSSLVKQTNCNIFGCASNVSCPASDYAYVYMR